MSTIRQIAQETGFSASTVSIVLNNKGDERNISQHTQKAIFEAAKKLNYQPSISARTLRAGNTQERLLALYFSADYRSPMMNRFTNGLWACPDFYDPNINAIIMPYEVGALSSDRRLGRLNLCHGSILCNMNAADLDFLAKHRPGMPAVLYNRELEGYSSASVDNDLLGEIPARVFARTGGKRAAVLVLKRPFLGVDRRAQTFALRCLESGLEVLPPLRCESSCEGGYHAVQELLAQRRDFDCLFCAADMPAYGALRALKDAGIDVPGEVQVISIGNGDPQLAEYFRPSLSQVEVPIEQMAQECFHLVMRQIETRTTETRQIRLPVQFLARESTRPLPQE